MRQGLKSFGKVSDFSGAQQEPRDDVENTVPGRGRTVKMLSETCEGVGTSHRSVKMLLGRMILVLE